MDKNNILISSLVKGEVYAGEISMARKELEIKMITGQELKFTPITKAGNDYKILNPTDAGIEVAGISLTYISPRDKAETVKCEVLTGNCAICPEYIDFSVGNWTEEHKQKFIKALEKLNFKIVKEV